MLIYGLISYFSTETSNIKNPFFHYSQRPLIWILDNITMYFQHAKSYGADGHQGEKDIETKKGQRKLRTFPEKR